MKQPFTNSSYERSNHRDRHAFTLIELVVVILVTGVLGTFLFYPVMARTTGDSMSAICRNNLRQLGLGVRLFQQDHNEMFPPAALEGTSFQVSWDSYIHPYIGGTAGASDLSVGLLYLAQTPRSLRCPTDFQPKMDFLGGETPWFGIRSYAMVGAGPTWGTELQVDSAQRTYPLPKPSLGVGISWSDSALSSPDWEARSYKGSVVIDPARTLLLVEEPNKQGAAGNPWPCISLGVSQVANRPDQCQMDPAALQLNPPVNTKNQGAFTYLFHGSRFNYLLHDGHVEALATKETIGTGTLANPKGMWTLTVND